MSDAHLRFVDACRAANPVAAGGDYPPFTAEFRSETPLNSAPYIFDIAGFRAAFGGSARRRRIVANCEDALGALERDGVVWQMVLVGGSFIRSGKSPSDLDGLVLYSVDPARPGDAIEALTRASQAPPFPDVDLKFCPSDVHPIVLIKRVIFFSNLFSYDRDTRGLLHGTVVLIPDAAGRMDGSLAA